MENSLFCDMKKFKIGRYEFRFVSFWQDANMPNMDFQYRNVKIPVNTKLIWIYFLGFRLSLTIKDRVIYTDQQRDDAQKAFFKKYPLTNGDL